MSTSPLLIVSLAYLIGLFLSFYNAQILIIVISIPVIFLFYKNYRAILLFLSVLIFSIFYGNFLFYIDRNKQEYTLQKVFGQVMRIEPYYDGCKIWLKNKDSGMYEIISKSACGIAPGYYCEFEIREKVIYKNPFGPSLEARLLSKDIVGELSHPGRSSYICLEGEGPLLESIRYRLFLFSEKMSPLARGLFQALVLGVENQLPREYLETLKEQGLYHQLAISGFNLAILYFFIYHLISISMKYLSFSIFGIPRQIIAGFLALPGAGLILLFSGFQASALRAFVFLVLYTISKIMFRNTQALYLLFLTALLLTIFSPNLIGNVSFQLSFVATLAIILSGNIMRGILFNKYLTFMVRSIFASTLATLFTAPFILKISGSIPILSPVNNLIYAPLWSFLYIPGSIISALFVFINEEIAKFLMEIVASIFSIFINIPLPELSYKLPLPFNLFLVIILFMIVICIVLYRILKKIHIVVGLFIIKYLLLTNFFKFIYDSYFLIIIPKFYSERAIVIKDKTNHILILRLDEMSKIEQVEIEPMLRKFGIQKINYFIIENQLRDIIFKKVARINNKFEIENILFYEDLLSSNIRMLELNREIIPIDEDMYILEFYGLSLLINRGSLKKMLLPSGLEIIYTEKISSGFVTDEYYIIENKKRKSAFIILLDRNKNMAEVIRSDDLDSDLLSWLFFPIFRPEKRVTLPLKGG